MNQTSVGKLAVLQLNLLHDLIADAPFQPATNLWRCIELPVLAETLPKSGIGLDVGCGDGVLTGILRSLVGASWSLTGIDVDPAETELARRSGQYETVHTCGAATIPEPRERFDFAFANSVLEHIPDLSPCIGEIARCLKPGGLFVATVPSPYFHTCLAGPRLSCSRSAYLAEIDTRLAHRHYWSESVWKQELRAVGLAPEPITAYLSRRQVRAWEFWSHWTGGLLYRLGRRTKKPIAIQRKLGLRRGLPDRFKFLSKPFARLVGAGVLGQQVKKPDANGCFLVLARKLLG